MTFWITGRDNAAIIMKPLFESVWKQRVLFFIGGVAISGVCMCIQFMSMSIVPYATFDQQPDWLKALKKIIGWFPWFAFAIVLGVLIFFHEFGHFLIARLFC